MGAVASLSRDATLWGLDLAQVGVFVFGFFFLLGWIAEETTKHRWRRFLTLFVVMAIVGVAGEWIADIAVFALSEHLQTISDSEVANLKVKAQKLAVEEDTARRAIADAGVAQERLAKENLILRGKLKELDKDVALANARVKEADARIAKLKVEAETARQRIAEAEARTKEANAQIATANEKAEAERLARMKLEKSVSWRNLTDEGANTIAVALRPFAGEKLDVFAYRDEPDAMMLAVEIASALGGSLKSMTSGDKGLVFTRKWWWQGWKIDPNANRGRWRFVPGARWDVTMFRVVEYGRLSTGIVVETSENANSTDSAAAKALVSALKAANLDASGPSAIEPCPWTAEICVNRDRDVKLMGGTGDPTAPIELTIGFRPPPALDKGK
jgi:hypothetical protein